MTRFIVLAMTVAFACSLLASCASWETPKPAAAAKPGPYHHHH